MIRTLIAIRPDYAPAYSNLGSVYASQGRFADALAAWRRAVGLDPKSAAGRATQENIEIVRARLAR